MGSSTSSAKNTAFLVEEAPILRTSKCALDVVETSSMVEADSVSISSIDSDSEDTSDSESETELDDSDLEDVDEVVRSEILAQCIALKQLAVDYAHPEIKVKSCLGARCFFDRASAPSGEVDLEREEILADALKLKSLARAYAKTAGPLSSESTASARCYFERASKEVTYLEEVEGVIDDQADDDEVVRSEILAQCIALKQLAVDYAHPEIKFKSCLGARCFFDRASAPSDEVDLEREEILADALKLKSLAAAYAKTAGPLSSDSTVSARCYFERASKEVTYLEEVEGVIDDQADDDEVVRSEILAQCIALKQLAVDYAHPEIKVQSCVAARCFFDRASAPSGEVDLEREEILADALKLKSWAAAYSLNASPVISGPASRCFFDRASAPSGEVDLEREEILADALKLKHLASAYAKTAPSLTADPTATARCYFERASKEVTYLEEVKGVIDDQADSTRTSVLAQSSLLAKFASHYLHPEQNPVTTSSNCCRSWFNRPTSQEEAMEDDDNARSEILADAEALKSWASAYSLNAPPITSGPGARSFFSRPRAPTNEPAVEPALPPQLDRSRALSDQFEMEGFGSSIMSTTKFVVQSLVIGGFEEHDEGSDEDISDDGSGKLSRSPSSIMLFEQGAQEAN